MARVLVVEDDADTRDVIRSVLYEGGHEMILASDGRQALAVLRVSRRRLVVLLDLVMPGLDGLAVLRAVADDEALRAQHAFILMTASPRLLGLRAKRLLARLGASALAKPFDIDDLYAAVAVAARTLR